MHGKKTLYTERQLGATLIPSYELFDIEDKIMLYDLTNTLKVVNKEAAWLYSGEAKRSDAKLVVLALVIRVC